MVGPVGSLSCRAVVVVSGLEESFGGAASFPLRSSFAGTSIRCRDGLSWRVKYGRGGLSGLDLLRGRRVRGNGVFVGLQFVGFDFMSLELVGLDLGGPQFADFSGCLSKRLCEHLSDDT